MGSIQADLEAKDAPSSQTPVELPIIDFAALDRSPEERAAVLNQIDRNFQTHGMVYLKNHTVPEDLINEAFDWVRWMP